jgi:hypothetical protein
MREKAGAAFARGYVCIKVIRRRKQRKTAGENQRGDSSMLKNVK